ncbi:hypothetical protein JTE90_021000 [Oedothorax gibbosus]|uniref:Uncharacterized protein n=1 Tax=Oedothorax gibbosus TaxID=931172 RepID=A0AAV6TZ10_9ARAC|nr:hypothetical protein JTE90_021000 [Oedothorax gibbosus]
MNTSIVLVLAAVCAFACLSVNAEHDGKCKDEMMKLMKETHAMLEDGSAPACANELDLKRFKCSGGEDHEADEQSRKEFVDWIKSLDSDKRKEVQECMKQLGEAAVEKLGDEISAECKEKMENFAKKMAEKHKEE